MAGGGDSTRAIYYALGANFAIAVAKGVAAFFTGSSAMLAETVHSLADCGNQGLLLLGLKQAKRPPSPDYPLGYGKAIYFWSFLVAVAMTMITGNPLWDALGTIMIGALLIIVAVFVAIEVKALLIGQSVDPQRQQQIRQFLDGRPEVAATISVLTLQMGNDVMVSVQAHMRERDNVQQLIREINAVEVAMKQAFPEIRWSFFEPEQNGGMASPP